MGIPGFVTVPPLTPGDQFPPILFNVQLPAAVASIPATNLITAPMTGTYRLGLQADTTVLGTGATTSLGYHAVNVICTDPTASTSSTIVNTSGTAVTWVSGPLFNTQWTGTLTINGVTYTISSVTSTTALVLTATAGTQTAVPFSWHLPSMTITAVATFTLGTGTAYNGALGSAPLTAGQSVILFRALAGTAIQLSTTLTAAGGSPAPEPNIVITAILECVGQ